MGLKLKRIRYNLQPVRFRVKFVQEDSVLNQANGPKKKDMFHTSVTWFIFYLQRGKILIAQQHIYNKHNELFAHVWRKKRSLLGVGGGSPLCKDTNFPPHKLQAVN
jgi:hypothetical protein